MKMRKPPVMRLSELSAHGDEKTVLVLLALAEIVRSLRDVHFDGTSATCLHVPWPLSRKKETTPFEQSPRLNRNDRRLDVSDHAAATGDFYPVAGVDVTVDLTFNDGYGYIQVGFGGRALTYYDGAGRRVNPSRH